MNANIVISLDTRRKKKDGTYPLIMRLGHNGETTSISLGINVKKDDWDLKTRVIKKSYHGVNSVTYLNNLIQKRKADAMDIILKLDEASKLQGLSITALRDRIAREGKSQSFFEFASETINELLKAGRVGTARSYKELVGVLKRYRKGKELYFEDMTYDFLAKFETYHKSRGNGVNGLAVYMRTIRAIFNKAIKSGIVERTSYPFEDYKIKTVPTEKRALEWEFLKRIIESNIPIGHPCFNTRNYFLASYMMYGMNFTDMAFLKKTDIEDGRIKYRRRKTSKLYDIKITENLQKLLSYYMNEKSDSQYVFPVLKRDSLILQYKDIQWARKRYNKKLKLLAEICGIDKNLTSYVSRHSFATQAMLQQVPLNAISAMLGHSSLKTTEVYLKSLPSNILDDYNAKILQY